MTYEYGALLFSVFLYWEHLFYCFFGALLSSVFSSLVLCFSSFYSNGIGNVTCIDATIVLLSPVSGMLLPLVMLFSRV